MKQAKVSFQKRWDNYQASKMGIFWIIVGTVILTIVIGFNWGGWVTEYSANELGKEMAQEAVVQRLASICVFQFEQDPQKAVKLSELLEKDSYPRINFVKDQGWATMPAEDRPNHDVAEVCSELVVQNNQ